VNLECGGKRSATPLLIVRSSALRRMLDRISVDSNCRILTMKKLILWLLADALVLYGVPILYYNYLARMVNHEYATGIRTSSDGDIILIPVVGLFMNLLVVVLIINILGVCYHIWAHRRKRAAQRRWIGAW